MAKRSKNKSKKPNNIKLQKDKDAKQEGGKTEKENDRASVAQVCQEEAEAILLDAHTNYKNLISAGLGPGNFEEYLKQFLSGYEGIESTEDIEPYYGEPKAEGPEVIKLHKEKPIVPDLSKKGKT